MSSKEELEEFEEQLRLMKEEEKVKAAESENKKTYTDKDGTMYEWDEEKKAYFPKIDMDFIAKYQANYGENEDEEEEDEEEDGSKVKSTAEPDKSLPNYADFQEKLYQQFYVDYQKYLDSSKSSAETEEGKREGGEVMSYEDYYKYWYSYQAGPVYQMLIKASQTSSAKEDETQKRKLEEEKPAWFDVDESKNTNVYVSGLPSDVTMDEYVELMSKYGIITKDDDTGKPKLKLYKDEEGNYKGDGLCCYLKRESVDLCLQLLDEYELRGKKLKVAQAEFHVKGEYNPALKKLKKKENKKKKAKQEKLLGWKPEPLPGVRKKHERVVVVKNFFDPQIFEKDSTLILQYQKDVREECSKFGEVRKIQIYDRHPEGVLSITFKSPEEADVCVENLHGRFFAGRHLSASLFDGRTRYQVEETEEEKEERMKRWHEELEGDEEEGEEGKGEEGKGEEGKGEEGKGEEGKGEEGKGEEGKGEEGKGEEGKGEEGKGEEGKGEEGKGEEGKGEEGKGEEGKGEGKGGEGKGEEGKA